MASNRLNPSSVTFFACITAYYIYNFLFRWHNWIVFKNFGAYGFAEPSTIDVSLLATAFIGLTSLLFLLTAYLNRTLIKFVAIPALITAFIYFESNVYWFNISKENIRVVDFIQFLSSDLNAHFGVDRQMLLKFSLIAVIHIIAIIGSYWVAKFIKAPRALARKLTVTLLVMNIAGLSSIAILSAKQNEIWTTVVARFPPYAQIHAFAERQFLRFSSLTDTMLTPVVPKPAVEHKLTGLNVDVDHIVVLAVEGFNTRFLTEEIMPCTTAIKNESLSYNRHYSSGNNTLLGTLGILYGELPIFYFDGKAKGNASTFINQLNTQGYTTSLIGEGLFSYRNIDSYLTTFSSAPLYTKDEQLIHSEIDKKLATNPRNFIYVYYDVTHFPYKFSSEYNKFTPSIVNESFPQDVAANKERIINSYKNTLYETDHFICELANKLKTSDSLFIITGDHGESMFEYGRLSHASALTDVQVQTPFIVSHPNIAAQQVDAVTSHINISGVINTLINGSTTGQSFSPPNFAISLHNNQNSRPVKFAAIYDDAKVMIDAHSLDKLYATNILLYDMPIKSPTESHKIAMQTAQKIVTEVCTRDTENSRNCTPE